MKVENYEQAGKLNRKLKDVDKKLNALAQTDPSNINIMPSYYDSFSDSLLNGASLEFKQKIHDLVKEYLTEQRENIINEIEEL